MPGRLRFASAGSTLLALARFVQVVVIAALASACNIRDLELDIYAPRECPATLPDGTEGPEPECPLAHVRSFRAQLEQVDGVLSEPECTPAESTLCTFEDLSGHLFLQRSPSSEGVEILITGWTEEGCEGERVMTCETFGESVVDLTRDDDEGMVPIWCDCPRIIADP